MSYKYTQVTSDSAWTYLGYMDTHEISEVYNRWVDNDLEISMKQYINDITKVPLGIDWDTHSYYGVEHLNVSDIANKEAQSPGRYVMVLTLIYKLKSVENDYYFEQTYKQDSLKNIEIQDRKKRKDSLVQSL